MSRFSIDGSTPDIPAANRAEIGDALAQVEHLVPEWMHRMSVKLITNAEEKDDSLKLAEIHSHKEYRNAELRIYPAWLDDDATCRLHTLRHEMLHPPTLPLLWMFNDVLELYEDDEKTRDFIRSQFTKHLEAATEDYTLIIEKLEKRNS